MRALRRRDKIGNAIQVTFGRHARGCVKILALASPPALNDDAVHEIRIRIKKMRALLQLARAAMGHRRYGRAKRNLQRTSRCLGSLRDAKVMLSTSEHLLQHRDATKRAAVLLRLQRSLEAARRRVSPAKRRTMAHDLINAQKISSEWPGSDAGWNALAESLRHEYARARKEFESARAAPSDQRLHGLRKRSKSLLYVCEFLGTVSPYAKAKSTQLNRLAVCLGNFHDLWLLKHANIPEHIEEKAGTKRRALQQRALRLGANIYCDSPGTFTKCVRKEWKKHR